MSVSESIRISHRGQKREPDPLELELRVVVSSLTWVLGTEFLFFTAASARLTSERLARLFGLSTMS